MEAWVPKLGVGGLLEAIEEKLPNCHDAAHELGKAAYAVTRDLAGVIQACSTRCVSGCMHGVLMEAFTERPDTLRARIATLCDGAEFRGVKKGDCVHGVGHGAAYVADYDVGRAVSLCEALGERAYQYYCASGAYMQLFMTFERKIAARRDHYPCDEAGRFAAACYRYKVFFLMARLQQEGKALPAAIVAECLGVPVAVQPACFHGIGHAHVGYVAQAPGRIREVCGQGTPPSQWLCLQGVVEKMAEVDPAAAGRVCAELTGKNLEVCREAVKNKLYGTTKAGLEHYFTGR
jgi:hypothetical protein